MRYYTKEAIENMVKDFKKRKYDIPLYDKAYGESNRKRIGTITDMDFVNDSPS